MIRLSTVSSRVLRDFGRERRRVFGVWRFAVYWRRVSRIRGTRPVEVADAVSLIRRMVAREEVKAIEGARGVYSVEAPFASLVPISVWHVIGECHPTSYFSHASAIAMHGLTNEFPSSLTVSVDSGQGGDRLPLGTMPEDWIEFPRPKGTMPERLLGLDISWIRSSRTGRAGVVVMPAEGQAVYATDLERTLIDSLIAPARSGGIQHVFEAWRSAGSRLDPSRMITHVEALGGVLLRQRIGFMLEHIGFRDQRLDRWRGESSRGGSARLVASREFSPVHSARWNLSLNVPVDLLEPLKGCRNG